MKYILIQSDSDLQVFSVRRILATITSKFTPSIVLADEYTGSSYESLL